MFNPYVPKPIKDVQIANATLATLVEKYKDKVMSDAERAEVKNAYISLLTFSATLSDHDFGRLSLELKQLQDKVSTEAGGLLNAAEPLTKTVPQRIAARLDTCNADIIKAIEKQYAHDESSYHRRYNEQKPNAASFKQQLTDKLAALQQIISEAKNSIPNYELDSCTKLAMLLVEKELLDLSIANKYLDIVCEAYANYTADELLTRLTAESARAAAKAVASSAKLCL
jgi:hypothetical protein